MKILLTNDDGYSSVGIQALYNELKDIHNVRICAPLSQKSASGHSITFSKPLKYIEINGGYAVEGTPADCVKTALTGFFKDENFDLVISGINKGANMGSDIFYSGTVAGAMEGLINDIPGIALSKNYFGPDRDYQGDAFFIKSLIEKLNKDIFSEKIILNINFPEFNNYKGVILTHLGKRVYEDHVKFENNGNESYVSLMGNTISFHDIKGSDLNAVHEDYISITPLKNEYFVPSAIKRIENLANELNHDLKPQNS